MTSSSLLKLDGAVIALLALVLGKGVKANDVVANVITGQKFHTYCDGTKAGINLKTPLQGVSIYFNDTQIYEASPLQGAQNQDQSMKSWKINVTWLPDPSQATNFNVTITVPSVKKKDQGRLDCQAQGGERKLLKYLFVYDDEYDHLCPDHWYIYPIDKKCVSLVEDSDRSWSKANSYCKVNHDGHLVVIPNQAFEDYLKGIFQGNTGTVWIGLTDLTKESTFEWIDGGKAEYTNWMSTPQTSTQDNCVEKDLQSGGWRVESCNKTQPFVCEKKTEDDEDFPLIKVLVIVGISVASLLVIGLLAMCIPKSCFRSKKAAAQTAEGEGKQDDKSSEKEQEESDTDDADDDEEEEEEEEEEGESDED